MGAKDIEKDGGDVISGKEGVKCFRAFESDGFLEDNHFSGMNKRSDFDDEKSASQTSDAPRSSEVAC